MAANDNENLIALAESLLHLSPQDRVRWLRRRVEMMIHQTPTGLERAAMTEANICLMAAEDAARG